MAAVSEGQELDAGAQVWRQAMDRMLVANDQCPECRQGKHGNCDGTAWDDATDAPAGCPCAAHNHSTVCRHCGRQVHQPTDSYWQSGLCLPCLHGPLPSPPDA